MIDLDDLLYHGPSNPPTWAQVVEFFRDGEFHEEHYLVAAIKKHLLTEEQREWMHERISIEDMLNGRTDGAYERDVVRIFEEWNTKLGFHHFGF
jgi:hypothetical protein